MNFTGKYESEDESSDEDISEQELVATFRLMQKKACITVEKKNKTISVLHGEKENLILTITVLEEEIL